MTRDGFCREVLDEVEQRKELRRNGGGSCSDYTVRGSLWGTWALRARNCLHSDKKESGHLRTTETTAPALLGAGEGVS